MAGDAFISGRLVAHAALAEIGCESTIVPDGLELRWDTPPAAAYRAWNIACGGTHTWDEFISYTVSPQRSARRSNIEWLCRHGIVFDEEEAAS